MSAFAFERRAPGRKIVSCSNSCHFLPPAFFDIVAPLSSPFHSFLLHSALKAFDVTVQGMGLCGNVQHAILL